MPLTRLILIAHAATSATRRAMFATGEEQLETAGLVNIEARRDKLPTSAEALTSPMLTARNTAAALGLDALPSPALRDYDAGRWTTQALAEIAPLEMMGWVADPTYADHGGESLADLIERLSGFPATKLNQRGTTIAVTHAAPVRAALVSALAASTSTFWHIDVPPLAAVVLVSDGKRWSLRELASLAEISYDR